ncbi:MAG: glutathionylspermidine synthase family protein [Clostridiales bacterium]|jgi:glutathionylspermidine synthase|nr:glutathionylspermidine synthase family protein [Clostridiales bacterium]
MDSIILKMIPREQFADYRYNVIFNAYKWDPQVEDVSTVAECVLVIGKDTAIKLEKWAEQLSQETVEMEEELITRPFLMRKLGLPVKIQNSLKVVKNYDKNKNIRLMRFDFHPTESGWNVSEVNSDVPGGLAEASVLPKIAGEYFPEYTFGKNTAEELFQAFKNVLLGPDVIAFVHATSYSDDRQVMQFLSDYFNKHGLKTIFAAPDHIKWEGNDAICFGNKVGAILRFFPLEWLPNLPRKVNWKGYFTYAVPSCNHPIAILLQSKRIPLVWDELGTDVSTWRSLLPETRDPRDVHDNDGWIYKPALGRVGEGISIKPAVSDKELGIIKKAVKRSSGDWVAQRMFTSKPVETSEGDLYHICVGVFTVNGKSAGMYGRINTYPRIDAKAKDIPVLISGKGDQDAE